MLYLNSIDFEYDDGDATDDVPSFMVLGMMNRPRRHQLRQRSALRVSKASPFWAIGSTFAQPSSRSTVTQLLCRICSDYVGLWLPQNEMIYRLVCLWRHKQSLGNVLTRTACCCYCCCHDFPKGTTAHDGNCDNFQRFPEPLNLCRNRTNTFRRWCGMLC